MESPLPKCPSCKTLLRTKATSEHVVQCVKCANWARARKLDLGWRVEPAEPPRAVRDEEKRLAAVNPEEEAARVAARSLVLDEKHAREEAADRLSIEILDHRDAIREAEAQRNRRIGDLHLSRLGQAWAAACFAALAGGQIAAGLMMLGGGLLVTGLAWYLLNVPVVQARAEHGAEIARLAVSERKLRDEISRISKDMRDRGLDGPSIRPRPDATSRPPDPAA